MEKWTQEEAIAFECARECITHLMAICTDEMHNGEPTEDRLALVNDERKRLAAERRTLHVEDTVEIERIRRDYGQRIRAERARTKVG